MRTIPLATMTPDVKAMAKSWHKDDHKTVRCAIRRLFEKLASGKPVAYMGEVITAKTDAEVREQVARLGAKQLQQLDKSAPAEYGVHVASHYVTLAINHIFNGEYVPVDPRQPRHVPTTTDAE